jgi:hypothetical protein
VHLLYSKLARYTLFEMFGVLNLCSSGSGGGG